MRLTYDSKADAMYIEFTDAEVISTKLLGADGNINADLDEEGNVVGIEIVSVQTSLQYIERISGLEFPLNIEADIASPTR